MEFMDIFPVRIQSSLLRELTKYFLSDLLKKLNFSALVGNADVSSESTEEMGIYKNTSGKAEEKFLEIEDSTVNYSEFLEIM